MSSNRPRFASYLIVAGLIVTGLSSGPARAVERKLSFAVAGVIEAIVVKPGQRVEAGAELACLDTVTRRARLKAVQAFLIVTKSEAALAERQLAYAREQFDALSLSQAELDAVEIKTARARAELAKAEARVTGVSGRLKRATLRAPMAGRVVRVPGFVGQVINPRVENTPVVVVDGP